MLPVQILVPLIFILAALFYTLLGLYAWRKRPAPGVVYLTLVTLSMAVWSFTYALEIAVPNLQGKLWILNVEYIGIVWVSVFIFHYALECTGKSHLLTRKMRILLWSIPAAFLLLIWTNPLHNFMWDQEKIVQLGALNLLSIRFGIGSQIQIAFSFLLAIIAGIILAMDFLQKPGKLRIHISMVVIGIIFSIAGASTFYINYSPLPGVDFTTLFFLPAAIGLSWVTLEYRLSEVISLEHLTVLKNMKDGVIVLNEQKRILYINPVMENLLGRTEDEVIGQPFEKNAGSFARLLPGELPAHEHRSEFQTRLAGEEKTFEVIISFINSDRKNYSNIVITLHDITQRTEKERELSRYSEITSAISRAAEVFLKTSDWEQQIPGVLEQLSKAAGVSHIYVTRITREEGRYFGSIGYEWTAPKVTPQINNPLLNNVDLEQAGFKRWVELLSAGQIVHGLVSEFPREERELLQYMGGMSTALAPIIVEGEWWGSIGFDDCSHPRRWTEMELSAFQIAASIFGAAESHARTEKKLIMRQGAMNMLHDIMHVSLQATSIQEMADTIATRLAGLIGADGCFLTMWDEHTQSTIPLAAYGPFKTSYPDIKFNKEEKTFTRSALEQERPLIIEDVHNTPYASPVITQRFPSRSLLALPLIARKKKLGALLISFDTYHLFQDDEVQISEQAAGLIALALEKFQYMDEIKRRADTSETLRKVGLAIAENTGVEQAVDHILEQLQQVVSYDSASVQLLEGNELVIVGGHGWKNVSEVIGMRFPIPGDNPNSEVIRTGNPLNISEPWQTYTGFKQPPSDHIRSWMGVPLIVQKKVIGQLSIDSSQPNKFKPGDVKIAMEFANQVAVALENIRLLQESQMQAVTDALTGVYNRRGVMELGEAEFSRALALDRPFSAIMLDLDHFKQINDTYGHAAGDLCLREFAQRCQSCIREIDYIGRYGGEELIIFLPDSQIKASINIAERLRTAVSKSPIQYEGREIMITASLGVACKDENTNSLGILIARADQAMYVAKHNGRNRVAVSR